MVPVGVPNPPDRTAVSETEVAEAVRVMLEMDEAVVTVGLAGRTVRLSPLAPHASLDGLLLESPL